LWHTHICIVNVLRNLIFPINEVNKEKEPILKILSTWYISSYDKGLPKSKNEICHSGKNGNIDFSGKSDALLTVRINYYQNNINCEYKM